MYKTTQRSKKYWLIPLAILLVIGAASSALYFSKSRTKNDQSNIATPTVNLEKPTPEEQQAADDQKEKNIERDTIETAPSTNATADLRLTDANQYGDTVEVRGFVANIIEDGNCVASFTKSGQPTVTTTSSAFKDASTTQCGANDTPRSKFSATGEWQLVLKYTSNSGKTGTATNTVTIK